MAYLLDTNILLRWTQPLDPQHALAVKAVLQLREREEELCIVPQNLVEFWNVATRPVERNGFGLTPQQADAEVQRLEQLLPVKLDVPQIHAEWRRLVVEAEVRGVQVHDARLAAAMRVHGVSNLLTFNVRDFTRFGVTAVHPSDVNTPDARPTDTHPTDSPPSDGPSVHEQTTDAQLSDTPAAE
jgi:predicted nucleic acid-binding protein